MYHAVIFTFPIHNLIVQIWPRKLFSLYVGLIRDALNILTGKSYITQRHIKFYHSMHHISSQLFSLVRAPTRTRWHHSRIIDITRQHADHLHRWRHIRLCFKNFYMDMISRFLHKEFYFTANRHTILQYEHWHIFNTQFGMHNICA